MDTIQDICKQKARALGQTYQEISDEAGVPLQTVRNFFSSASKSPSIYTAGPICKVLGISLDEYFVITDRLTPTEETLTAHRDELEHHVDSQDHAIARLEKSVIFGRHIILGLLAVVAILIIWCVYLDMSCYDIGFWRG